MIIAVDGPAASGKGTIARALATHYGLPHLDTGLLYRAVGLTLLRAGGDPESEADAAAATTFPDSVLADPELRTEATGALASRVSAHAAVRAALMARQRAFAHQPGGAVLDGRDIGTVIAPEAGAKLYVTASPRVRAERRAREMERMGQTPDIPAMEAIEKDVAVIDVGLKTEGRVALKEFTGPAVKEPTQGRRRRSRSISSASRTRSAKAVHLARQGAAKESWVKLEKAFNEANRKIPASKASSSARSRAASPSISTAPWPSCRARRSTSARSATSAR
jgi:cytidylate kinase